MVLNKFLHDMGLSGLVTGAQLADFFRALLILGVGLLLARLLSTLAWRVAGSRLGKQESMLVRRFVFYGLVVLLVAVTLHRLGFQLSVLLGAAGILTVAIGFASQTSASNLISGLFLIAERPFVVGDIISVDGATGEVLSVDLLSVKLRTYDNLYVRIPNETIIKTRINNLTHFPLRRVDVKIGVAYKEDLAHVRAVLMKVAEINPLCLEEPPPLFIFMGFGDSALEMQFSVWGMRTNYLELLNTVHMEIKAAFDLEGIEIPFPHRTLYAGSATGPLPIRVVEERTDQ